MKVERGNIYTIASKGPYAGKPQPALVMQTDALPLDSIVIVPLTSNSVGSSSVRIALEPTVSNGLKAISWAMCDKLSTIPISNLKDRIGTVEPGEMRQVGIALLTVLDLLD